MLLAKYIPQVCGTEIHNETLTTPSTYCSKLLFLSKQQTTSSRTRVREVLESTHSVASMPTHAQQTYTQSGAYPRNIPEQDLATKPAKKTRAIPTETDHGISGEHDPEGVNVNSLFSIPDGLRADGRRTPAH